IGGRVAGQEAHDPLSVWSLLMVAQRRFSPFWATASGFGSAANASANHTALALSALGTPLGRGTPVLPSPDSASHLVSSARTGSLTGWPRCLASRIDQTTRLAWWQEAHLYFCFQARASLTKNRRPRLIVGPASAGFGPGSAADAADGRPATTKARINRIAETPNSPGLENYRAPVRIDLLPDTQSCRAERPS